MQSITVGSMPPFVVPAVDLPGLRSALALDASASIPPFDVIGYSRWFQRGASRDIADVLAMASELTRDDRPSTPSAIPAAYTYFGQLVAHDLSFFSGGSRSIANRRTPVLDLDNVYGDLPAVWPFLYAPNGEFRVSRTEVGDFDIPRTLDGSAIVPDLRDDSTIMIAQMHLAWMRLHNRLIGEKRRTVGDCALGTPEFAEVRSSVLHTYQWITVFDYLRRMIQESVWVEVEAAVSDLASWSGSSRRLRRTGASGVPVEFAFAVMRFGHSMVRDTYRLNSSLVELPVLPAIAGRPEDAGAVNHLFGFRRLPDGWQVDWELFDGSNVGSAQTAMRIDASMVSSLTRVPRHLSPDLSDPAPGVGLDRMRLAFATLMRSAQLGLPSARTVAGELASRGHAVGSFQSAWDELPLWLFILHEADAAGGSRLGTIGSILLAEGILEVLANDENCIFKSDPSWTPVKVGLSANSTLGDVLRYAVAP